MNNNHKPPTDLIDILDQIPLEQVYAAQCASMCSLFIRGAYLSATVDQLVNELGKRHGDNLDLKHTKKVLNEALTYGLETGILQSADLPNQYTPTDVGWMMGEDWDLKMRLGWGAGV